jgi:hypothetical protein
LPGNPCLGRMAPLFPLRCCLYTRFTVWDPPIQAWDGQGPELSLGSIEPTAMLGGMVALQTRGQPAGLLGRPGLIEGPSPMRLEVSTDQADTVRLRLLGVQAVG